MKIIYFFGNFCSLWSQSCLKHSTQWVNEVEWVSMVKVILWPWSKVTQISKLNVWIWACLLRWAIQGLLGLLFHGSLHLKKMFSYWAKISFSITTWDRGAILGKCLHLKKTNRDQWTISDVNLYFMVQWFYFISATLFHEFTLYFGYWLSMTLCHNEWPHNISRSVWPIFHGPVILLNISNTVWWIYIVLGILV